MEDDPAVSIAHAILFVLGFILAVTMIAAYLGVPVNWWEYSRGYLEEVP